MDTPPKLPRVDEFDALRGILALWVAVSHILCWSGFATATLPRPFGRFWPGFVYAQPAVEVFMILSGFAISFLLHAKKQSYLDFMRGRFFRIYPTYLVCLALGIGTIYLTPSILGQAPWRDTSYFQAVGAISQSERRQPLAHILSHLTLLNGLIPRRFLLDATGTMLPPAWSISLEWQYYLVAPVIAFFVRSVTRLLLLSIVTYVGIFAQDHWVNPHLAFLPAQLPLFLVGIGSYHLYSHFARAPGWRSNRFGFPIAVLLASAFLLSSHPVALTVWMVAFGCIFVEGDNLLARTLCTVRKVLLNPWLQRLGSISYPLYLVHWPIIILCLTLLLRWKPTISSAEAGGCLLLVAMPLILLVAGLLHRYVEVPLMGIGKRRAIASSLSADARPQ